MIAAVYDWSGFYIGANGGWGTSRNCWDVTTAAGAFLAAEGCHDADGGIAGGQVGYRWQAGHGVFGLEAQGNWADLRGSNASTLRCRRSTPTAPMDAFGLFTGQIGYAWNNALLYVKGGAAVTDSSTRHLRGRRRRLARQQRRPDPLGRHGWRRPRIWLRSELVGGRRIRPSVHAARTSPSPPAGGFASASTASVRTSISSPLASTTAGAAR